MKRETICVQGCGRPANGEPRQIPIVESTTFRYESSEAMAKLFNLEEAGYFYTRLANPTNDAVAKKIAALEGGSAAILTASAWPPYSTHFQYRVVRRSYRFKFDALRRTYNLFSVTMKRMGIEVDFAELD